MRLGVDYVADVSPMFDAGHAPDPTAKWKVRVIDLVHPEDAIDPRIERAARPTRSGRARGRLLEVEVLGVPERDFSGRGSLGVARVGDRCVVSAAQLGCEWTTYTNIAGTRRALTQLTQRSKAAMSARCAEITAFLEEVGVTVVNATVHANLIAGRQPRLSAELGIPADALAVVLEVLDLDELPVSTVVERQLPRSR